jgi:hypothetical protein
MVLRLQQSDPARDVRDFRQDAPAPLAAAIMRALEKDPAARWRSAEEMLGAVSAQGNG